MGRLRDRIVLVTGAAGGVGAAVAEAIAGAGGVAIGTDLHERPRVDHVLDVTREADWRAVIDRIGSLHGRLDGLVNAADATVRGSIEETTLAAWRRAIDVNVLGTFLGIQAAWAMLGVAGGSVVNVSRVAGPVGTHDRTAASAAAGAVRQLTRAAALDAARQPSRIRVNAVQAVDGTTDLPLGRPARREEIATFVLYLLSDESAFVTGASYALDAGLTAM
jgi:NAD(P)-dependent dehydrogenase (short-subunit alcohol dehydrogenase family)